VGPICETGDFLAKERFLHLQEEDLLGKYYSMSKKIKQDWVRPVSRTVHGG
jgi:diaminopimelate decarboxylase